MDFRHDTRIAANASRQWFEELRDRICAAFEKLEDDYAGPLRQLPAGRFARESWRRPTEDGSEGGGGDDGGDARPRLREGRRQCLDRSRPLLGGIPQADPRRRGRRPASGRAASASSPISSRRAFLPCI